MSQLKKYLCKKLDLGSADEIQILCNDEVLGSELSLYFVKCTRWMGDHDLQLSYRRNAFHYSGPQ